MKDRILLVCPATMRMGVYSKEIYHTLDLWIKSATRVTGISEIYVLLNDIPEPFLSDLLYQLSEADIKYDIKNFGHPPDGRDLKSRNPELFTEQELKKAEDLGKRYKRIKSISKRNRTYERFVNVRNLVLDYANTFDFLFSVDSDCLIPPNTVEILLEQYKKTPFALCSILIDNMVRFRNLQNKQSFHSHVMNYGFYDGHVMKQTVREKVKKNQLIPVGYTGSVCLIDLNFIREKKIRYGNNFHGEDADFCRKIHLNKGKIFIYTGLEGMHVQDDLLIPNGIKYLETGIINYERNT